MTKAVPARSRRSFAVVLLAAFLSPSAAAAVAPCDGVDTSLSEDRKHEYAERVADVVGKGVTAAQVDIHRFMQSENWSAVYVSTPETDNGVLFFEAGQFKEVWGGSADASERAELTGWAKGIGAPEALASCFADTVTG